MTSVRRPRSLSRARPSTVGDPADIRADAHADDLRRMVLLLETADVLDRRARRTTDPAQVAVLRRRAEQRRAEAGELRARLAAHGAALPQQHAASSTSGTRPRF